MKPRGALVRRETARHRRGGGPAAPSRDAQSLGGCLSPPPPRSRGGNRREAISPFATRVGQRVRPPAETLLTKTGPETPYTPPMNTYSGGPVGVERGVSWGT